MHVENDRRPPQRSLSYTINKISHREKFTSMSLGHRLHRVDTVRMQEIKLARVHVHTKLSTLLLKSGISYGGGLAIDLPPLSLHNSLIMLVGFLCSIGYKNLVFSFITVDFNA